LLVCEEAEEDDLQPGEEEEDCYQERRDDLVEGADAEVDSEYQGVYCKQETDEEQEQADAAEEFQGLKIPVDAHDGNPYPVCIAEGIAHEPALPGFPRRYGYFGYPELRAGCTDDLLLGVSVAGDYGKPRDCRSERAEASLRISDPDSGDVGDDPGECLVSQALEQRHGLYPAGKAAAQDQVIAFFERCDHFRDVPCRILEVGIRVDDNVCFPLQRLAHLLAECLCQAEVPGVAGDHGAQRAGDGSGLIPRSVIQDMDAVGIALQCFMNLLDCSGNSLLLMVGRQGDDDAHNAASAGWFKKVCGSNLHV